VKPASADKKQGLDVEGPAQSQTVTCGVLLLFVERQDGGNQLGRASVYRALDR